MDYDMDMDYEMDDMDYEIMKNLILYIYVKWSITVERLW